MSVRRVGVRALVASCFAALGVAFGSSSTRAQERLPTIPPAQYDEPQKKAADDFLAARKTPVFGPFEPMLHSPELMSDAWPMGAYLRYNSAMGTTLSELVILLVARNWSQDYEWFVHAPIALKQGIAAEIVAAIEDGRRPEAMSVDEAICYDFVTEFQSVKRVSDATYARAQKRFGDKGVVDLTAIVGYYTLLAMQLNVARYVPPEGAKPLPRFP